MTEQARGMLKTSPQRWEQAKKRTEELGGKQIAWYATMGEYDFVLIAEFPNDEVGFSRILEGAAGGRVIATTMKAFNKEEYAKAVSKLP